ncbi:MAG: alpha/beta fold hydrolase [Pseudomonadota bacterium]
MIVYPVAAGAVLTRVFEAGDAGPAVVFLHGLTSRADRFRQTLEPFAAAGYRVYAPDLPGHGFATKDPSHDHSIGFYRDFVLALLDRLEIEQAVLIGTSLGGHVMAAAACHSPGRVRALVTIGSLGYAPVAAERVARIRAGLADWSPAAMRARLLTVFTDPRFVTDDLIREDIRINTSPGARESLARFADYMATRFNQDLIVDGLAALGDRFPTLLLWGEDDQSVPVEIGRAARRALPQARLATIRGVNHTPYLERPDLFNPIVLDFLAGRLGAFAHPDVTYG